MREVSVSVALASYNGERYIEEQIRSILKNLEMQDEIIVSDDGSTDSTLEIIKSIDDPRVMVIAGPGLGIKKNFEHAISNCGGRYIFLADQDDVWAEDKVDKVVEAFLREKAPVVVHDCEIVDDNGHVIEESFYAFRNSGPGKFKNHLKNTYIGCCMAFDAALKDSVLPIPDDIEMHDQWIGIIGDNLGDNVFIPDKLIRYRRHENNASDAFHHHSFMKMLKNRIVLLSRLTKRGFL